jgi:16S rRNA (guanine1207-N2)-methyltransferase
MSQHSDPALDTLFLPFIQGELPWRHDNDGPWPDDGVLFLRARAGQALRQQRWPGLQCEQSFKPDSDLLRQSGMTLWSEENAEQRFKLILILPPRQREESRALFARAASLLQPGGRIVASVSNNEGARSSETDLEKLCGAVHSLSKHKCRAFWTAELQPTNITAELQAQWQTLDAVRPIVDGRFVSRPGVFAWDRIDPASALLAAQLPKELQGRAADLGAGFGFLSHALLTQCPGITSLDVYEAEQRALQLAERNLASLDKPARVACLWHDVTSGLSGSYDVIVTNPPFHTQSRVDRPDIGQRFIAVAAAALKPGGQLWLVANRHLPYEAILDASFGTVKTVTEANGFKIIQATRAAAVAKAARTSHRKPA